ncbi:FAD-dependent oxidoreductase [Granulicella arctica]|uniref:FAD-dependent oxidoreductase n=1 Tax=Granulicella arctica TaxID=940613 RepID=UPI0021DFADCB|nr:FAD-dependent oxidoreductase [Granulicella arctica]
MTPTVTGSNVTPEEYDLVVIGSGEGSKFLAWTLARQGQRVAMVERKWIGGSCPNIACLPSKNIIHSAKVASYFARAAEFGIASKGYTIDMAAVTGRKRKMVKELVDIHVRVYETTGVELILGQGYFIGPQLLQVDLPDGTRRQLHGKKVVIGTGTRASVEDIPGLATANPLTHVEALELDTLPQHLLILGGGYIGLEFAQAMRRLGSKVSILERNANLLHREDPDVSAGLETLFREEGVDLVLNATVEGVSGVSGQSVTITYKQDGQTKAIEATHILVATGRTPNTDGIGLELAGVELTASGHIKVNEKLETTAPGVWANGEVAGSPQFTHIAFDDFRILRDNFAGGNRVTTGRQVPFALFTDPEVAHIGLSETEAKKKNIAYRLFKIPMAADLRTRTLSETRGFMKALVAEDDGILGFTVFGVDGGEIMSAVQIAMIGHLPYTALRDAILTHPTLMEGLIVLFSSMPTTVAAK